MRRREFIVVVGGAIAGAPALSVRGVCAPQATKERQIGVLMGSAEIDFRAYLDAFVEELARLGWIDGRNARIDVRWTKGDIGRVNAFATELVAAQPDIILCSTTAVTAALHRETTTIPIVFTIVSDPVGARLVAGMSRPGGTVTGFTHTDPDFGGKWLGLLKQMAPGIKRAAIVFNPETSPGGGKYYLGSFESAAGSLGIEPVARSVGSDAEIEIAIAALGAEQAGMVAHSAFLAAHLETVIASTTRHKVPASFENLNFVRKGGLISYGANFPNILRGAAGYVDRILRGEKPADLPVQTPTKFEMAINLRTAQALGLTVPPTLLTTADEVIE